MTAHARGVDLADRSSYCLAGFRGSCRTMVAVRRDRWVFLGVCLMAAGLAFAGESGVVEDIVVPVPETGGSFSSMDGGYESVLIGDGDDAVAMPDQSHMDVVGQESAVPVMGSFSSDFDPTGAVAEAVQWGGSAGCVANDHSYGGTECGPCGDACQDAFGDCFCGSGGGVCHGGCRPGSLWAIQADALVLWRNNFENQPLITGTNGMVALDAGDVQTAAAAGPRIGVLRSLGCGRAIEGNYFNVGGIQGSTATDGVGAPYTPVGLADIAFSDIGSAEYTTRGQIKSAELNYRWCQGRRIIWLAGFRWVEWNEVATVDMQEASGEGRPNNLQANVGNDLYGGQFGCRLKFWDLGKWQVGAVGKAGVFGNTAYQRTTAVVDGTPFGPIGADDDAIAFFGEVGINSTLWLNRWLAWRAGYNFFWLQGVATAAQQLPLGNFGSETTTIVVTDAVFLQGFSTGLEARW
jgi:hypothetical protein